MVCPDSGTSLSTFPPAHNEIFQGKYGDYVDCSEGEELEFPDMTYVIEGKEYVVPSHHWVRRHHDKSRPKGGSCHNNISELDVGQPGLEEMHILGDVFMQLYYTIHDRDQDRIGLAPAKHELPEVLI